MPLLLRSSLLLGPRAEVAKARTQPNRLKTHRAARLKHADPAKTGSHLNALTLMREEAQRNALMNSKDSENPVQLDPSHVLHSPLHAPAAHVGWTGKQLYPSGAPHNFAPLRPVPDGFSALDRAVREKPWESRFDLVKRRVLPKFMSEVEGTPRVEYQDGMVNGIRVRPVMNPYVQFDKAKAYVADQWPSRNWAQWDPLKASVRGGRKKYDIPKDILPYKDELGEVHPPRISGRYQADLAKQYAMNGLPWVFKSDFMSNKVHFHDREPRGPVYWYRREFRKARIKEAMNQMPKMIEDYRKERRESKRYTWFEQIVHDMAGEQLSTPYMRKRETPKL